MIDRYEAAQGSDAYNDGARRAGATGNGAGSKKHQVRDMSKKQCQYDLTVCCPSSVPAAIRRCIHRAAECSGIEHVSQGEGDTRFISLRAVVPLYDDEQEDKLEDESNAGHRNSALPCSKTIHINDDGDHNALLNKLEKCFQSHSLDVRKHVAEMEVSNERTRQSRQPPTKVAVQPFAPENQGSGIDGDALAFASVLTVEHDEHFEGGRGQWCHKMEELLEMEKKAETDAAASEATRLSIPKVVCTEASASLLGRTVLKFAPTKKEHCDKDDCNGSGSAHGQSMSAVLSSHDIVAVRANKSASSSSPIVTGVVYRCSDKAVSIAIDGPPPEDLGKGVFRIDKLANDVTYNRLKQTVAHLESGMFGDPCERIVRFAFQESSADGNFYEQPHVAPPSEREKWKPFNVNLDQTQIRAVDLCLRASDFALIHGPPGTGKTTALIELLLQLTLKKKKRVLCCAASNIAVDNIVERLMHSGEKIKNRIVRYGHPARLLPTVLACSLESRVNASDSKGLAKDCKHERNQLSSQLLKCKSRSDRKKIFSEMKKLEKEARQWETEAVQNVSNKADIVLCTLTVAADVKKMRQATVKRPFDVVVIDEAAQALEVATWSAILHAKTLYMAGDHLQLPPTVISDEAAAKGLSQTLFAKLISMYGSTVSVMLDIQYRMNKSIMAWSSQQFYEGKLMAHSSVATHSLKDLGIVFEADVQSTMGHVSTYNAHIAMVDMHASSLLFIDSAGCCMQEAQESESLSRYNSCEADVVIAVALKLVQDGVNQSDIGIITPYAAQVTIIREKRDEYLKSPHDNIEVSTVDGFQGREKEVIIISCVRSNDEHDVGFLQDYRRMNVAVTRARRLCIIIGDSETMDRDATLSSMVRHFEDNGESLSAEQILMQ